MYRTLISLLALLALTSACFAASKKKPAKAAYSTSRTRRGTGGTSKSTRASASARSASAHAGSHTSSRYGKRKPTQARRSYQGQPTPERYREIQQSLADKGYFKGEVNGQWGPDSVDALRRFQADQNLEPDGKLGSLSLIALGLGPKRMTAQTRPEQQTVPANQPEQTKKEQP